MNDVIRTSKTVLQQLETWISTCSLYSCTRQYPHPGYVCDRLDNCPGCLIVAAALELRRHALKSSETPEQRRAATDAAALADAHRMYEATHGEPFPQKA